MLAHWPLTSPVRRVTCMLGRLDDNKFTVGVPRIRLVRVEQSHKRFLILFAQSLNLRRSWQTISRRRPARRQRFSHRDDHTVRWRPWDDGEPPPPPPEERDRGTAPPRGTREARVARQELEEEVVPAEDVDRRQPGARLEGEPHEASPAAPHGGVRAGSRREDLRETTGEHVQVLPRRQAALQGRVVRSGPREPSEQGAEHWEPVRRGERRQVGAQQHAPLRISSISTDTNHAPGDDGGHAAEPVQGSPLLVAQVLVAERTPHKRLQRHDPVRVHA
eukprot:scaffold1220_cov117-Isochrysis_galbana.AAC.14